ncbi:glycosyltransferase, partial [Carnobacterium jeotgali]
MPVYNTSATLGDAVKSVLEQRFSNFELILIND